MLQFKVENKTVCSGNMNQIASFAIRNRSQSVALMRDITGLLISSILYHRKVLPAKVFTEKKLANQKVRLLRNNTDNILADNFASVILSAYDAIELGYLKEMSIMFVENNQVIEIHKLSFEYTGESYKAIMIEETYHNTKITLKHKVESLKDQIYKTISNFIKTLEGVPCSLNNPSVAIDLAYFEDITPPNYQPKLFEPLDGSKEVHKLATQPINFGHVMTPFQSVKIRSQFKPGVNEQVIQCLKDAEKELSTTTSQSGSKSRATKTNTIGKTNNSRSTSSIPKIEYSTIPSQNSSKPRTEKTNTIGKTNNNRSTSSIPKIEISTITSQSGSKSGAEKTNTIGKANNNHSTPSIPKIEISTVTSQSGSTPGAVKLNTVNTTTTNILSTPNISETIETPMPPLTPFVNNNGYSQAGEKYGLTLIDTSLKVHIPISSFQSQINEIQVDLSKNQNQDTSTKGYNIRCPCLVTINEGILVKCSICNLYQHIYCFDMLIENHVPNEHICDLCAITNPKLKCTVLELPILDRETKRRRSLLRLSLGLCYCRHYRLSQQFFEGKYNLRREYAERLWNEFTNMNVPMFRLRTGHINKQLFEQVTVPKYFRDQTVMTNKSNFPVPYKRRRLN